MISNRTVSPQSVLKLSANLLGVDKKNINKN
jgi:hypothetical protein